MARSLTFDEAISLLQHVKPAVFPEVHAAMELSVRLGEGQAKVNCGYTAADGGVEPANIPGTAYQPCPYEKPPHETGNLSRSNHGWTAVFGDTIQGFVGNSAQEYNVHVHEGTSRMPGRPFLYDACRMQQKNIMALLSAGVAKGLKKVQP